MDLGIQLRRHLQLHLQASIQTLQGIIFKLLIGHLSALAMHQTLLNCN